MSITILLRVHSNSDSHVNYYPASCSLKNQSLPLICSVAMSLHDIRWKHLVCSVCALYDSLDGLVSTTIKPCYCKCVVDECILIPVGMCPGLQAGRCSNWRLTEDISESFVANGPSINFNWWIYSLIEVIVTCQLLQCTLTSWHTHPLVFY